MTRLIVPLSADERTAMIAAARTLLGVPFRHRGRTQRGVDCIGMVAFALSAVGREIRDKRIYGRDPIRDGLREAVREHLGDPIPKADMAPGDVLVMAWHDNDGPLVNHVAMVTDYVLGGLGMVHALAASGRVIEHILADPWPRRIVEVYRP